MPSWLFKECKLKQQGSETITDERFGEVFARIKNVISEKQTFEIMYAPDCLQYVMVIAEDRIVVMPMAAEIIITPLKIEPPTDPEPGSGGAN